jgi:hypothetical protein
MRVRWLICVVFLVADGVGSGGPTIRANPLIPRCVATFKTRSRRRADHATDTPQVTRTTLR